MSCLHMIKVSPLAHTHTFFHIPIEHMKKAGTQTQVHLNLLMKRERERDTGAMFNNSSSFTLSMTDSPEWWQVLLTVAHKEK